jgi:prefoldin subunit 5
MADEDNKNNDAKPSEEEAAFDSTAAVDAIVEGTRNRADEIEEALEGALDPVVLSQDPNDDAKEIAKEIETETVKASSEVVENMEEIVLDLDGVGEAKPSNKADNVEEPKLQIHVGRDDVRISTGHPLIDDIAAELEKSRKFTMYAVSSLCVALLAGVLFFILMSTQIVQKISQVDAMLGAVAKRTLQVTKGIETFSTLEERIGQTLLNQTSLAETLAANDLAVAELESRIAALNESMQANIGQVVDESSNYLVQTRSVLQEENQKAFNTLGELQSMLAEHRGMIAPISNLSRELSVVKGDLTEVRQTIDDLYIIERARMARELLDQRDADLDASGVEK